MTLVCLLVLALGVSQKLSRCNTNEVESRDLATIEEVAHARELAMMQDTIIGEADNESMTDSNIEAPSKEKRYDILFVGNSKTYEEKVPEKLKKLAQAADYDVEITEVTSASRKPYENLALKSERQAITAKSYDYVVLQEQTDTSLNGDSCSLFQQGVTGIASLMRENNPDAQIIIRQVWVRLDSDETSWADAMNAAEQVALACETSRISRDGKAMYYGASQGLSLFADRTHQNKAGAYLCACCIYRVIFGNSVGNPYTAGLSNVEALQELATRY